MESIKLDSLVQAKKTFDNYAANMPNDQCRTAAVKAFEICYELSWKLMKVTLESYGEEISSPKSAFRKAAMRKLIDDPETWFDFQKQRNLTSHVYKEEIAKVVAGSFYRFSIEVDTLIDRIKSLIESGDIMAI